MGAHVFTNCMVDVLVFICALHQEMQRANKAYQRKCARVEKNSSLSTGLWRKADKLDFLFWNINTWNTVYNKEILYWLKTSDYHNLYSQSDLLQRHLQKYGHCTFSLCPVSSESFNSLPNDKILIYNSHIRGMFKRNVFCTCTVHFNMTWFSISWVILVIHLE